MVEIDRLLRIGLMRVNQACRISDRDFRTEVFKKSTGAV